MFIGESRFSSCQQIPPGVSDGDDHVESLDCVELAEAAGDDLHCTRRASREPTSLREILGVWVHTHGPPSESGERPEKTPSAAPDVEHAHVAGEVEATGEPCEERHLDGRAAAVEGGVAAAVAQACQRVTSFHRRGVEATAEVARRPATITVATPG